MKSVWKIFSLLLLCACTAGSPAGFKGYYSFKTGGFITVSGVYTDLRGSRDTAFVRHLVPESGQMHVLRDGGDKMVVTMNITGGDPVVFDAYVSDGELILDPVLRSVRLHPALGDEEFRYDLMVGGRGRKKDNMILFDLEYSGDFPFIGLEGSVTGSEVHCIATENE